jgi:hypothetical protein
MNNTDEASLYCRRLELITFSPHKMLKMQTMCSNISAGIEMADFLLHRGVACRMQCSRLRAGHWLRLPFIASLYYIISPKLAKSHH